MDHFIDIVYFSFPGMEGIYNFFIMVCKNSLKDIHKTIMHENSRNRIGEILPSPSTPRSVPFGTTRFNSLHVLSDSAQSWMDIRACPLLLSW